jgi:predicted helicase
MTLREFLRTLGSTSAEKGWSWELATKALLKSQPPFCDRFVNVYLWREWPEGPALPEIGIDLVAVEQDGSLCAIQAKNYVRTPRISKHDLETFVSASANSRFSSRLLVATAEALAPNAERVRADTGMQAVLRGELEDMDVDWTRLLVRPTAPDKFEPKPHQLLACQDVVDGLQGRGQLIMACGTGKTLTSLLVYERLSPRRALVLVPSLGLLRQFMREWAIHRRSEFECLAVCSDTDVADTRTSGTSRSHPPPIYFFRARALRQTRPRSLHLCAVVNHVSSLRPINPHRRSSKRRG